MVEVRGDSESERSILRDEELGGILQTSTVTVEFEGKERDSVAMTRELERNQGVGTPVWFGERN